MDYLLKDELSRRHFITGMAKTCLGVSTIMGAKELVAFETPSKIATARPLYFCIWQEE